MKLDPTTYESTTNVILANGGPYKHRIKRLVRNSQLEFFGVEEERVDLSRLKKDFDFWLRSLEDLLYGNYLTWHFPSRVQMLRNSQQRLDELKSKYHLGKPASEESRQNDYCKNVLLSVEEMTRRVAGLVKELRNIWISASIKYAVAVARSSVSMRERRLRLHGVFDFKLL